MEAGPNTEDTPIKAASDEQKLSETTAIKTCIENTNSDVAPRQLSTEPTEYKHDQSNKHEKLFTEHTGNGRENLSVKSSNENKEPVDMPTKEEYDNPVDHGWSWMILISAFLICLLTIGGIKSFGVLLVELSRQYDLPKSLLSLIQSLTGFFFLSLGPVSNALSMKYSFQKMTIIGGIFTSVGLILTSFAKSVEVIFVTYGILTGAGFGLSFSPSMVFLAHHFKKRRALANGIALSGGGMGSMVLPYLMRFLIDKFSLQGCMLILSAIMAHIMVCGALFRPLYKYPRKPLALQMVVMTEKDCQNNKDNSEREKLLSVNSNSKDIIVNSSGDVRNESSHGEEKFLFNSQQTLCVPHKVESPVSKFLSQESINWKGSQRHLNAMNTALCASLGAISSVSCQNIPNSIDPLEPFELHDKENPEDIEDPKSTHCSCVQNSFLSVMEWSLFKDIQFVMFFIYIFLVNVCYHCLFNCLPSFAEENNIDDTKGALLIAFFSITDLGGRIFVGWISDIFVRHRTYIFGTCSLGTGIFVALIPMFTSYLNLLVWLVFCGLFAGGYNGLIMTIIVDQFGLERLSSAWGFACFSASVALFSNPLITGSLRDQSGTWDLAFRFSGCMGMLAGSLHFLGLLSHRLRRKGK